MEGVPLRKLQRKRVIFQQKEILRELFFLSNISTFSSQGRLHLALSQFPHLRPFPQRSKNSNSVGSSGLGIIKKGGGVELIINVP